MGFAVLVAFLRSWKKISSNPLFTAGPRNANPICVLAFLEQRRLKLCENWASQEFDAFMSSCSSPKGVCLNNRQLYLSAGTRRYQQKTKPTWNQDATTV